MEKSGIEKQGRIYKIKRVRSLISGTLFNSAIGVYYIYGGLNPVIYNFLKNNGNPDITPEDCLIVQPVWLITQSIFAIVGVKLSEKTGLGLLNWVGSFAYCMVFLAISFFRSYSAVIYVLAIGAGLCSGIVFLNGTYIAWSYFPNHKGFAAGCIFMSAGFSSAIMSFMTTNILNPSEGLKPSDPEMYERVPMMFKSIAIYYTINTLIAGTIQPETYKSPELKEALAIKKEEAKSPKKNKGPKRVPEEDQIASNLRS